MSVTVVGLYDDHTTAEKVFDALVDSGFAKERSFMRFHDESVDEATRTRLGGYTGPFGGDLIESLTAHGVPTDESEFYAEGVRRGGSLVILTDVAQDQAPTAIKIMEEHNPITRETREAAWKKEGYTGYKAEKPLYSAQEVKAERDRYSLKEVEENLNVGKREVETGSVRVHKRVIETPVEEQVSLHKEEVHVERVAASGEVPADAFEEQTIELKETAEEAVVSKTARVTGEVVIDKEGSNQTQTISDTVRRVEIEVEELPAVGKTLVKDNQLRYETFGTGFKQHFDTTFGKSGGKYEEYEPAYRYGYQLASDDRFRGAGYDTLEPKIKQRYDRDHGAGAFDRFGDAIKHSYNTVRTKLS